MAAAAVLGAEIGVHRFSEPLPAPPKLAVPSRLPKRPGQNELTDVRAFALQIEEREHWSKVRHTHSRSAP